MGSSPVASQGPPIDKVPEKAFRANYERLKAERLARVSGSGCVGAQRKRGGSISAAPQQLTGAL
jgi:hypothetical protein